MTVQVTILASESEACADFPITDDDIALEPDEVFEITLTTPADVPSSPDPSTVTIIDDDGKKLLRSFYGWVCLSAQHSLHQFILSFFL